MCFELLRLAIGNTDHLSFPPTDKDWRMFYDFCKRQTLLGVGFTAVERFYSVWSEELQLVGSVECGVRSDGDLLCPKDLRIKWMAAALKIEERNKKMSCQCRELTERLEHDGLHCCILKGQGNLLNYPENLKLRRTPGDIDVWCVYHGCRSVIEYVQKLDRGITGENGRAMYHHINAPDFHDTEVEVHYRPSFCHSPLRNIRMQRWFKEQADICMKNKNDLGFATPTSSVNVVYQMCHLFSHYFETGLGLRQLMDYYFVLMLWNKQVWSEECGVLSEDRQYILSHGMWTEGLGVSVMSKEEIMHVLCSFGMGKFAAAVMWVLHEVFAMPTHYYIYLLAELNL